MHLHSLPATALAAALALAAGCAQEDPLGSAFLPETEEAVLDGSDAHGSEVALSVDPVQARIDLGRRLMFDVNLSRPAGVSCGMCHDPQFGWGDGRPQGKGVQDNTLDTDGHDPNLAVEGNRYKTFLTPRNTPTVYNSDLFPRLFWDGRAGDLAHQAVFPFEEGAEMNSDWQEHILPILRGDPQYRQSFEDAYGTVELTGATWDQASLTLTQLGAFADYEPVPDDKVQITGGTGATLGTYRVAAKISKDAVQLLTSIGAAADGSSDVTGGMELITRFRSGEAIGVFEATISAFDTPYDAFLAGDTNALTPLQKQGHDLFFGAAGCAGCHPAPNLTDFDFHNTGVPTAGRFALEGVVDLGHGKFTDLTQIPAVEVDEPSDYAKFRTPQLRMLAVTGPYMHNGGIATLEEVVEFYDQGGGPDLSGTGTKSPALQPLGLTAQEKEALVAFLREGLLGTEIK